MMLKSIQSRFILVTLGTFALGVLISFVVTNHVILKNFAIVETSNGTKTAQRASNILTEVAESLHLNAISWSYWDDIYNYAAGTFDEFIGKSIEVDSLFDTKWSHVFIYKADGSALYAKKVNINEKTFASVEPKMTDYLNTTLIPRYRQSKQEYLKVLTEVDDGHFYLFYIGDIKRNDKSGDKIGYFIVTKEINASFLKGYADKLQADIRLYKNDSSAIVEPLIFNETQLIFNQKIPDSISDSSNNIYLSIGIDRMAYQYAKETFSTLILFLSVVFGFASLIQFYMIRRNLFSRLVKLNREVAGIKNLETARIDVIPGADEVSELSRSTHEMLDRLKEDLVMLEKTSRFAMLGEMSATVAHEINNPLSIIKMISSNSKGKWSVPQLNTEEVAPAFLRINKTADRIHKIVRSLRSLGRDATSDPLEVVPLSVVLEDTVSLLEHKIKMKEVELRFKPESISTELSIRQVLFTQVLVNLISNAIDAIEPLPERWIDLKVEHEKDFIKILIVDSGNGVPDAVADKLMESVFTTKGVGKGTGLGLRLCRSIIEGHAGQLYLDRSTVNTTFIIRIPTMGVVTILPAS